MTINRQKSSLLTFVLTFSPFFFLFFFTLYMNIFRFRSSSLSAHPPPEEPSVDHGPVNYEPLLQQPTDYEPVLNPPLDEEKEAKITRLLDYMETIILDKEDPYYPNERKFITKGTVHRYMRARKWDFEVTTQETTV